MVEEELLTQDVSLDTLPGEETTSQDAISPDNPADVVSEPVDPGGTAPLEEGGGDGGTMQEEEHSTTPYTYIGNLLAAATMFPGSPVVEPTEIVANTVGESRHYRMQAAIAGGL